MISLAVRTTILGAALGCSDGFVINPTLLSHASVTHTSRRTAPLKMVFEPSTLTLASPLFSAAFSPATSPLDPFLEAELFNDAAHVALDFATMMGPATVAIRALAVIGRIFVMASDYVPDHAMLPEEFVFQVVMLGISSAALARSLPPMFATKEMTMRDRKCFDSFFRPAGITWMQYKLVSATAMEWTDAIPGAIITTDEMDGAAHQDLYWLYRGEIEIQSKGEVIQRISSKTAHLLGDLTFANTSPKTDHANKTHPKTTAKAGLKGATLLRVDTIKLKELMKRDDGLDKAVRNMLLDVMQERIASLLSSK